MGRVVSIEIDGEKLRKEFEVRNLKLMDASNKCGFEQTYFSKSCRMNRITKPAMNLLQQMFNIRYEDYKIDEPEQIEETEVKENPITITEDVSKALYDIIYSAVYEAVKKAWSE